MGYRSLEQEVEKRTTCYVTDYALGRYGYHLEVLEGEALAAGVISEEELLRWLRASNERRTKELSTVMSLGC